MLQQNSDNTSLATGVVYHALLEIGDSLYYVNDNQDLTWNGHTYEAFPFTLGTISSGGEGERPQTSIKLSNVDGSALLLIEALAEQSNVPVVIKMVRHGQNSADITLDFTLGGLTYTEKDIDLVLGPETKYSKTCPSCNYNTPCQWEFKDFRCRYSGNLTSCNHTEADCMARNNITRYGGFRNVK